MLDTEYNEAEAMELFKEEGRIEGREEGREIEADVINDLNNKLLVAGRVEDLKKAANDREYQKQLIRELVDPEYNG